MQQPPREQIDRLHIHDAWFLEPSGCPLCRLLAQAEERLCRYYLSPAQMEPSVRQESNQQGFCARHLGQLLDSNENRLTLALVLETYLAEQRQRLAQLLERRPQSPRSLLGGLLARAKLPGRPKRHSARPSTALEHALEHMTGEPCCLICSELEATEALLLDGIFACYREEEDYAESFYRAPYCLPHLRLLLHRAPDFLPAHQATELESELLRGFLERLRQAQQDCHQFSLQFDYRYHAADLPGAKGALERARQLLCGGRS